MTQPIAFIAGCFDGENGFHEGHRYILTEMRKLAPEGTYIVAAVNSDAYLARKGPGRPLSTYEVRRAALYASGLVDEVFPIEDTPIEIIKMLQPAFICVGRADYKPEEVVGYEECTGWGGKVVVIEKDLGVSTTEMVKERGES